MDDALRSWPYCWRYIAMGLVVLRLVDIALWLGIDKQLYTSASWL